MLGYHFVGETLRDGRPIPPDGEWLIYEGPVAPCKSGLHMSEHPFDALKYAPGSTLCLVELDGDIVAHGTPEQDKHVGRRRRIICRADATTMLRRFAADQALSVAHLWDMPDIVREYLTTLDESKPAAWYAARDAAQEAASWDAAATAAAWAARNAATSVSSAWQAATAAAEAASWAVRAAMNTVSTQFDSIRPVVRIEFKFSVDALLKKKVTV